MTHDLSGDDRPAGGADPDGLGAGGVDADGLGDGPALSGPALWDANARPWTRAVRERWIESRTAGTDAALIDVLTRLAPRRLLDAGCGEGWLVRALRNQLPACRAIGVDGATALIAAARAADPLGCYYLLTYDALAAGAWRDDPLLAEQLADPVDVVVFNYALFDRDIGGTLRAARQLLAPGGAVVVQTLPPCSPGEEGWRTEDFAGFGGERWVPMRWYARSRPAWEAALADAGLGVCPKATPAQTPDARSLLLAARPA